MENLKIAVAQITSVDDVQTNLDIIMDLLNTLNPRQVSAVFFPENCLYMRLKEGEKVEGLELSHFCFTSLARWSQENGIGIHLGSIPLRSDGALHNASIWINSAGHVVPSYVKTHLFDIELEGQKPIRESDVFAHGTGPRIIQLHNWHIGQTICYDIRFSDLFHAYAHVGVEIITVPAAFLVTTGQAHWEVLLRARAIESQCYVVASAQSGIHVGKNGGRRETYGHSLVVDPWGRIILELFGSPELKVIELSMSEVHKVRKQIPMKSHRRGPFKATKS